ILDVIHAISYLFASAMAGRALAGGRPGYGRWVGWGWAGGGGGGIAAPGERAGERGVAPEQGGGTHPAGGGRTAQGGLQKHKDQMRYAESRRQGLPITSSYVESAVKQFNERLKGTEKFWSEAGAEALLQLRADYLGSGTALTDFWQDRQESATGQRRY